MFKILDEVNNLSLFYKITHLSSFMKGMGVLYMLVFIGFSLLFFQPSIETSNTHLNWFFITLIGVVFSITFLSSILKDAEFFHSYVGIKGLDDIEYDLIMKLKLYRHVNMKDILADIRLQLKDDEILISKEVTNYIKFLKVRLDMDAMLDINEEWFRDTYCEVIIAKKEMCKNLYWSECTEK